MQRYSLLLLLCVTAAPAAMFVNFESFAELEVLSAQVSGIHFENAIVLMAGSTLNELDYPPRSGVNAAGPDGGLFRMSFATGASAISLHVTYAAPVTLSLYDTGNGLLGSVSSLTGCGNNLLSIGTCAPNERLSWTGSFAAAVLSGGDFTIDDLEFSTAVPEPGTWLSMSGVLTWLYLRRRKTGYRSAVGLALASGLCWGASVTAPTISPPAIAIRQVETITASCRVENVSGPALLANGVSLLRVDSSARVLSVVGVMADNGGDGDAVANDGVFTRRFPVNESSTGELRLRCTVAFQGQARRTLSSVNLIPVVDPARALLDDRGVRFQSAAEVTSRRQTLIQHLWGGAGFPATKLPNSVTRGVPSPVSGLQNLGRVDRLNFVLSLSEQNEAHHFIPAMAARNRLVVLHHGHACTFNDEPPPGSAPDSGYGMQRTINSLLLNGYSVLAAAMPRSWDCAFITHGHYNIYATATGPGSPMRFFLEHLAASLNYFETEFAAGSFPQYQEFHMVGLSGGGWTTTVYSAIDPRIRFSFDVAGTIPLYLRLTLSNIGDIEQNDPAFYSLAGYPDLYVLGSALAAGRKRVQIMNRNDNCCFGSAQHNAALAGMSWDAALLAYENDVRAGLMRVGFPVTGFRIVIDETSPAHTISQWAISSVILAELNGPR